MWVCLLTWNCLSHCKFHNMAYRKMLLPCKMRSWIGNELIELINSDQLRLSIPIQFQFQIFQFNSNSIHAELNWIDYQFQFNSWIDPSLVSRWLIWLWVKTSRPEQNGHCFADNISNILTTQTICICNIISYKFISKLPVDNIWIYHHWFRQWLSPKWWQANT